MKQDKADVDYSEGMSKRHCGNCRSFRPKEQACLKVKGHILARMWCRLWHARSSH
jgi:hypothetical protein